MGRPGGGYRRWVTVGDDATVGANSLLVHDVPPRSVMLDVPVRVVARRGSFTQVVVPRCGPRGRAPGCAGGPGSWP